MGVLPFIQGHRVLEIGHGPGHLQRVLRGRGLMAVGLDESAQMGKLAKRNLTRQSAFGAIKQAEVVSFAKSDYTQFNLTRGLAQHLPFSNESFDNIVSTFPAEYIFDPLSLSEAARVLTAAGRFVILPGTRITGSGLLERFMAWVFRITGQTSPDLSEILHERSKKPFAKAGLQVEVHEIDVKSSLVFILVATKI